MRRKKKVTLPMIAEQLGLSVYTVSKALRGLPGMSEETRKEVVQLARQLGYLTKDQEDSLIYEGIPRLSIRQRRFLFVTSNRTSFSIQRLFFGLKERLNELGHKIDMAFMPESLTVDRLDSWMEQEGILYSDGIFISPLIPEEVEKPLLDLQLPRILINFPPIGAKVDSVIWDVYDATWQAVHYLLDKGHRNILYFGDTDRTRGYKLRWLAFREAMRQVGIEIHEESHLIRLPPDNAQWMGSLKGFIEKSDPTALLCALHDHLPWVSYAISETGRRIPQDISIAILDNFSESFLPDVTHSVMLKMETGYRAADRMLWRIANPHLPFEHIRLQSSFYEGSTVRKLD